MALFPIFSKRIAYELERRGFNIVKIAPNHNQPNLNVYYFEETLELHKAAQELIRKG